MSGRSHPGRRPGAARHASREFARFHRRELPSGRRAALNKFSQTPIKAPTGPRGGLAILRIVWAASTPIILSARWENRSFLTRVETVDFPFSAWRAEKNSLFPRAGGNSIRRTGRGAACGERNSRASDKRVAGLRGGLRPEVPCGTQNDQLLTAHRIPDITSRIFPLPSRHPGHPTRSSIELYPRAPGKSFVFNSR